MSCRNLRHPLHLTIMRQRASLSEPAGKRKRSGPKSKTSSYLGVTRVRNYLCIPLCRACMHVCCLQCAFLHGWLTGFVCCGAAVQAHGPVRVAWCAHMHGSRADVMQESSMHDMHMSAWHPREAGQCSCITEYAVQGTPACMLLMSRVILAKLELSALGRQCGTTPTRAARRGVSCTWARSRTRTLRQRAHAPCDHMRLDDLRIPGACCRAHDLP